MTAPRPREQRRPPSPPDRRAPRRGGGSSPSPCTCASAAGPAADAERLFGARRGLVRSARALAAAALLALSGALALPATAEAQEIALLSNTENDLFNPGNAVIVGDSRQAQGFNTGSNAPGYRLDSIELHVGTVPNTPSDVTVELWSANSDSKPDASVATLTHSTGTWATGANTFNAPADTELDANTLYFVHVSYSGERADLTLGETGFTGHDSGEAAGWSVGQLYKRNQGSWSTYLAITRLRFKINGAETLLINQPSEIRAYWNVPGQ